MTSKATKTTLILFLGGLCALNVFVWWAIVAYAPPAHASFYSLDVGQGDSEFVELSGGVKILIDGGPGNKVVRELDRILPASDRYIDILQMSHAQTDHFEGFIEVLKRYRVGAFLWSGRPGTAKSFADLDRAVKEAGVPVVVLGEGDFITIGESKIDVLSPSPELEQSKELNDGTVVLRVTTPDATALYTGDIGANVEKVLIQKYGNNLTSDILKVPHHGSKFSSSNEFLRTVNPKIAMIGVGKNSYGHPTKEALGRLVAIASKIFRTDQDGTIKIAADNGRLEISKTGK